MKRRASLAGLLLGALLALPPLAHASPTDRTWIAGFYDDNDYDDVILFITGAVTPVDSHIAAASGLVTVVGLGLITASSPQPVWAGLLGSGCTRARPHLVS